MKNQLSKREYKYRCKIIAECHLKKGGQKYLDRCMMNAFISYKEFYFDKERMLFLCAIQSVTKTSDVFNKLSLATKEANKSFIKMINVINLWRFL